MIDALTYSPFPLLSVGQHLLFCREKSGSREAEGVSGWFDSCSSCGRISPVCSLQQSHNPIYYRPPRSRLYLGIHEFFKVMAMC